MMKSEEDITDLFINNSKKFYSLCRFCLSENTRNGKSVFSTEDSIVLADKIMLCTTVQVRNGDGLPTIMCDKCYKQLEIVDKFRKECQNADKLLTRLYTRLMDRKRMMHTDSLLTTKNSDEPTGHPSTKLKGILVEDCENKIEDVIIKQEEDSSLKRKLDSPQKERNQRNLRTHKENVSEEHNSKQNVIFICDICRKSLKHKKSLENHIRIVHNEEKRKRDVGLVSGYGAERKYHCTECKYFTKYKIDLVIHIRRHTGERPYKCKTCNKSFAQQSTLNNHTKTHSDTMYFTCPHCGKQFKYKYKYEKHKNAHTQQQRYFCTICTRGLKSPKILEEHMNRHYNIKNYNCETCGSTFVTFSEMSIHSRIHGTEKRFKCHLCEYKTFVKASLEKHVRRHTGERPFVCDVCHWKCYTRGELKVHSRTHTKEKNYPCPVCSTSFKTSSALNKHVMTTHGIHYKWSHHKDRRIIK